VILEIFHIIFFFRYLNTQVYFDIWWQHIVLNSWILMMIIVNRVPFTWFTWCVLIPPVCRTKAIKIVCKLKLVGKKQPRVSGFGFALKWARVLNDPLFGYLFMINNVLCSKCGIWKLCTCLGLKVSEVENMESL
jgi:hypothetical protein